MYMHVCVILGKLCGFCFLCQKCVGFLLSIFQMRGKNGMWRKNPPPSLLA